MQIDLSAFTDFALTTFDYDADFEDDAFAVTFEGVRVYCERRPNHFIIHVGREQHHLPR